MFVPFVLLANALASPPDWHRLEDAIENHREFDPTEISLGSDTPPKPSKPTSRPSASPPPAPSPT